MSNRVSRILIASLGLATIGWSDVITSGSVGQTTGSVTFFSLAGSNFSITLVGPPTFFSNLPPGSFGSCPGHVCTYNFSQTGSFTHTNTFPSFTIDLNGTTYSSQNGNTVDFSLSFASSLQTVNQSFTPLPGGETDQATWSNIPFTLTGGSLTIFNGSGSAVASDTFTGGGGLAGGSSFADTVNGEGSSNVHYFFSDASAAPEPGTLALVCGGLAAVGLLTRKRRVTLGKL